MQLEKVINSLKVLSQFIPAAFGAIGTYFTVYRGVQKYYRKLTALWVEIREDKYFLAGLFFIMLAALIIILANLFF